MSAEGRYARALSPDKLSLGIVLTIALDAAVTSRQSSHGGGIGLQSKCFRLREVRIA